MAGAACASAFAKKKGGSPMDPLLDAVRKMRRDLGLEISQHVLCMHVGLDDERVRLYREDAAGRRVLQAQFAWTAIRRVCFKDNGPMASDMVYVIAGDRTLVIPLEADGGGDFWRQLRVRGVVPPEMHEQATLSMDGRFYCWPPLGRSG
jgi:hypothetical protein